MTSYERSKKFWEGRTTSGHPEETPEFYSLHAAELMLLFSGARLDQVLEIGCGDGALFPYLGFDPKSYRGVDISESMVHEFKAKNGDISVIVSDTDVYEDEKRYTLIFSNQVVQNFSAQMFDRHVEAAGRMLANGGRLVCASIPWRALHAKYALGELHAGTSSSARRLIGYLRQRLISRNSRWYGWREIKRVAKRHEMQFRLFGSLTLPYRFHVAFWRQRDEQTFSPPRRLPLSSQHASPHNYSEGHE